MKPLTIVAIIIAGLVVLLGSSALYTVHETEQAVILRLGSRPVRAEAEPGLKVKMPWPLETVDKLDARLLNLDMASEEVTASDQKRLEVDAFARFRIVNPLTMYRNIQGGSVLQARRRLEAVLRSSLREVLGKQELDTLLSSERAVQMDQIRDNVDAQSRELFGIEVRDVRIRRADLPPANTDAILNRMEAERKRDAQLARSEGQEQRLRIQSDADRQAIVLLAQAERESEELRGRGDAEAARIFAEAFGQDPEFFEFYRTMQAYRKSLGKNDTQLILSPDSEFFDYFGKDKGQK